MLNKAMFKKPLSFYLRFIVIFLNIPPIIYSILHLKGIPEYPWAIAFGIICIAFQTVQSFLYKKNFSDYIELAGAIFATLAASVFLLGGVLSIADYIAGVHIWGDSTQFVPIVVFTVMLFCSTIICTVNCFVKE